MTDRQLMPALFSSLQGGRSPHSKNAPRAAIERSPALLPACHGGSFFFTKHSFIVMPHHATSCHIMPHTCVVKRPTVLRWAAPLSPLVAVRYSSAPALTVKHDAVWCGYSPCERRSDSRLEVNRGEDAAGRSFGSSRGPATRSACAASSRGVAVAHAHARLRGSVTCV